MGYIIFVNPLKGEIEAKFPLISSKNLKIHIVFTACI